MKTVNVNVQRLNCCVDEKTFSFLIESLTWGMEEKTDLRIYNQDSLRLCCFEDSLKLSCFVEAFLSIIWLWFETDSHKSLALSMEGEADLRIYNQALFRLCCFVEASLRIHWSSLVLLKLCWGCLESPPHRNAAIFLALSMEGKIEIWEFTMARMMMLRCLHHLWIDCQCLIDVPSAVRMRRLAS